MKVVVDLADVFRSETFYSLFSVSAACRGVRCAPVLCHHVGVGLLDDPQVLRFFATGGRDDLPYMNDNGALLATTTAGTCGSTVCSPTDNGMTGGASGRPR